MLRSSFFFVVVVRSTRVFGKKCSLVKTLNINIFLIQIILTKAEAYLRLALFQCCRLQVRFPLVPELFLFHKKQVSLDELFVYDNLQLFLYKPYKNNEHGQLSGLNNGRETKVLRHHSPFSSNDGVPVSSLQDDGLILRRLGSIPNGQSKNRISSAGKCSQ